MTIETARRGLLPAVAGVAGLGAVVAIFSNLGDGNVAGQSLAYPLVVLPVGALLYGLLVLTADLAVPGLLLSGAAAGALSVAAAYLGGRPEVL